MVELSTAAYRKLTCRRGVVSLAQNELLGARHLCVARWRDTVPGLLNSGPWDSVSYELSQWQWHSRRPWTPASCRTHGTRCLQTLFMSRACARHHSVTHERTSELHPLSADAHRNIAFCSPRPPQVTNSCNTLVVNPWYRFVQCHHNFDKYQTLSSYYRNCKILRPQIRNHSRRTPCPASCTSPRQP